jgi:hypothetical protein
MRRHRVAGPLVYGTTTLLAAGAAMQLMATSAAATDSNRHQQPATTRAHGSGTARHRAQAPLGSTTVGVRVLPVPAAGPPGNGQAEASNKSDSDISADVDSGGAHHSSSHDEHLGSSGQSHGGPRFTGPGLRGPEHAVHRSLRHGGHSRAHHLPRPHRHGTAHQGILPFTGRSMTASILGGAGAVLTGAVLLWTASLRRKRRAAQRPGSRT